MIKDIIINKVFLKLISNEIKFPLTDNNKAMIKDLLDTSFNTACVGLAAPQIGWLQRAIAIKLSKKEKPTIMINPEIIKYDGKNQYGNEGCLSVPQTIKNNIRVKRWYKIQLYWMDSHGQFHIKKFKGFHARVIQHEIDHLNGVLIK